MVSAFLVRLKRSRTAGLQPSFWFILSGILFRVWKISKGEGTGTSFQVWLKSHVFRLIHFIIHQPEVSWRVAVLNYHLLYFMKSQPTVDWWLTLVVYYSRNRFTVEFVSRKFPCSYRLKLQPPIIIYFVWSGGVILVCHQSTIWLSNASPFLLQLIRRIIGLTAVAMSTHISHRTQSLRHLLVRYLPINNGNGAEQVELVQPLRNGRPN